MTDCRPGRGRDVVAVPPGTRVPAGSQEEWSEGGSWTDINSNESCLGGRMRWRCFKTCWSELNYTSWSPSVQPFGSIRWLMPLIFTRSVILPYKPPRCWIFEAVWDNLMKSPLYTWQGTYFIMSCRKEVCGGTGRGRQRSRPIKTWVEKKRWFSSCSVTCSVAADLKVPWRSITSLMWWLYIFKDTVGATVRDRSQGKGQVYLIELSESSDAWSQYWLDFYQLVRNKKNKVDPSQWWF